MVAILSSFMTEASLGLVFLNSGCASSIIVSVVFGFCVLEDMNAATAFLSPSNRISMGLSFVVVRFVKGKGMRSILPFNYS